MASLSASYLHGLCIKLAKSHSSAPTLDKLHRQPRIAVGGRVTGQVGDTLPARPNQNMLLSDVTRYDGAGGRSKAAYSQ